MKRLVLIALAAVSVGCNKSYDYANAPLTERSLAPLSIALPDWTIVDESDLGSTGKIRLADPEGLERFLQVSWHAGEGLVDAAVAPAAMERAGLKRLPDGAITVSGETRSVVRYASESGGKRTAAVVHYCAESNTSLVIMGFLNAKWSDAIALLERVTSSIKCKTASMSSSVPKLALPGGYAKAPEQGVTGIVYLSPAGDALMFTGPQAPNRMVGDGDWGRTLFQDLLKVLEMTDVEMQPASRRVAGREVWPGTGKLGGSRMSVLGFWLPCDNPPRGYIGIYIGQSDPFTSGDATLLASAQCP